MTTAGNIGFGLLILLILWIITIIVFVVAIKLQSNLGWIALGLSTVVTVILLIIPTDKKTQRNIDWSEKDYIIVYKHLILAVLIGSILVGAFACFIGYCIVPVRPKTFKSFYDN